MIALVPLITAIVIARLIQPVPVLKRTSSKLKDIVIHHSRMLGTLFSIQVFASSLNVGLIFLLPDFLKERGAESWVLFGGGHAALVLGGSLALLPAGAAADKWGARFVLIAFNVLAGALFASLLFGSGGTWSTLMLLTAFGAANGANNVVSVSEGNRFLPGQSGAVSALLMGLPWCFAGLAPLIVGHAANPVHGGNPTYALTGLGTMAAGSLIASALLPKRNR
jgi:MFS family permease